MANFTTECFYRYIKQYCSEIHPDYKYALCHFLKENSYEINTDKTKPLKILKLAHVNKFKIFISDLRFIYFI